MVNRFLRARTPAWATAGLAVAAVLVLALALAPGLRVPGRGASGASGSALGGGAASSAPTTVPGSAGQGTAQNDLAAPGSQAQRGATNLRSVAVPGAGGLTLTISTPSEGARRGDLVPVVARLGGGSSDQAFSQYSLTTTVVAGQAGLPGTVGGTAVGSATGDALTVRAGGSQDFVFQWVSSLGTPGPGGYTLVATLAFSGQSVSVSIPIALS